MMKKQKANKLIAIFTGTIAILVIFGLINFVKALNGYPVYIENVENANITFNGISQNDIDENLTLGASGTRFPNGISADSTSPSAGEVRGSTLTITGNTTLGDAGSDTITATGQLTSSATTTIDRLDSIDIPLNLRTATSEGGSSAPHTITVVGSLENTGSDLICDTQWTLIDIYTAMGNFAYGLRMGTSTSATSTEAHLITEYATDNEIGTTTTDILTKTDDEGSETEESWVWNNSEYVVITRTFQSQNASTSEIIAAGAGEATAHLNCRSRY